MKFGYGGSKNWKFAKTSFQMPLDGVFIGEKSLWSGSVSELRGTHPIRVGFGGFQMVTAHWFGRRSWEKWSCLVRVFRKCVQQRSQAQREGFRLAASDLVWWNHLLYDVAVILLRSDPMRPFVVFWCCWRISPIRTDEATRYLMLLTYSSAPNRWGHLLSFDIADVSLRSDPMWSLRSWSLLTSCTIFLRSEPIGIFLTICSLCSLVHKVG